MPRLNARNRATTTLDGALTDSATSFDVINASVLPDPPFRASIEDEIVEVTAVSTNTLTATRGVEGTSAVAHDSGTEISAKFTAGMYDALSDLGSVPPGGGFWYVQPGWYVPNTANYALASGVLLYIPIHVTLEMAFDQIGINVTTQAGTGGALARLGIYHADENGQPGALLVDAGTVAIDSTGQKARVISETLKPGLYFLAIVSDDGCSLTGAGTGAVPPRTGAASTLQVAMSNVISSATSQSGAVASGLPDPPATGGGTRTIDAAVVRLRLGASL